MNADFEVKIINLKTRPERLRKTFGELHKIDVTCCQVFNAFPGGNGGLNKSHLSCLKGNGSLLILEDDVVFEPGALKILKKAISQLPDDWDLMYLGTNVKTPATRHSANLFHVTYGVHATHSVLYSHKGREVLLRLYHQAGDEAMEIPFDHWLYVKGLNLMNCYVVWPMIAFQCSNYSDLRLDYMDYRGEMIENQKLNMDEPTQGNRSV
jgi:GR25 family glycosyltransferase involved in LPS biosynthesis